MNPQINRVFGAIAIGFALLIALTTYWQVWAAPSLAARQDNLREVVREQTIERGLIQASDGTRLALSRKAKSRDGRTVWIRRYPTRKMFAPGRRLLVRRPRTGAGSSSHERLPDGCEHRSVAGFLDRQLRSISGQSQRGNNVITTLSTRAQRTAMSELAASGLQRRGRGARTRATATCSRWPRGRATTPTWPSRAARPGTPCCARARARCSTARRRAATRRARRSRW